MSDPDPKVLLTIPKSSREDIVVAIREYKQRRFVDVRVWYEPREGGNKRPGKDGITLPLASLPDLAATFARAAREEGVEHAHAR